MKIYDKYEKDGAIHWQEYNNKEDYGMWADKIVDLFPKKGTILDIGCGDGLWTYLLAKKGLRATGIDISEYGIQIARNKKRAINKLQVSYPRKMKFWAIEAEFLAKHWIKDFMFDYALATEIIEHLWDYKAIKRIFHKYIKKYMILTTIDSVGHHCGRNHIKEFNEDELREEFKGYTIDRLRNKPEQGRFNTKRTIVLKISK